MRVRAIAMTFLVLFIGRQSVSAQPRISSLEPASTQALSGSFTLRVNGSGFAFGSRIYWNGSAQLTSYSTSQLSCTIPENYIANGGTATVSVSSDRVSFSNPLTFTILNPVPTLESITPSLVIIGGSEFPLTVNGTGFLSVSKVRWNGADRPTTQVSSTTITAKIQSSDIASGGKASVTIFNPGPAGGTSSIKNVVIGNPLPALTSFEPERITCGANGFTLKVNGSRFLPGSEVRWNKKSRPTTYVSNSELSAEIYPIDIATPGLYVDITVFNPSPGGGASNGLGLTIHPGTPTTTSLEPSSASVAGTGFTLTVKGGCFGNTVAVWSGIERPTTYVSSSELRTSISSSDLATAGTVSVAVFNKILNHRSETSNAQTFAIINPVPSISDLAPTSVKSGDPSLTLTVTGSNFVPTSRVRWNGADRPTTYVNNTTLTATITADLIERTTPPRDRTANVTVFNPPPLGGESGVKTLSITKN